MTQESAVQLDTNSRIHIAFAVKDLSRSLAFYRTLFGQEPTKTRPRYAKFEVSEPSVNLALNEVEGETGPNNPVAHFGIQVKTTTAVEELTRRLQGAGLETTVEEKVDCCFAVQNKASATDPDGNKWEVYVVLDNQGRQHSPAGSACCPQMQPVADLVQRGDYPAALAEFQKTMGMPSGTPASSGCGCTAKSPA